MSLEHRIGEILNYVSMTVADDELFSMAVQRLEREMYDFEVHGIFFDRKDEAKRLYESYKCNTLPMYHFMPGLNQKTIRIFQMEEALTLVNDNRIVALTSPLKGVRMLAEYSGRLKIAWIDRGTRGWATNDIHPVRLDNPITDYRHRIVDES